MEKPLPQKRRTTNSYIQYTVKGLNANIEDNIIQLSFMKNSEAIPFFKIRKEVFKAFKVIKTDKEVLSFINSYGNIFKEKTGDIELQKFKDEVTILRNVLRMITILKNVVDGHDLIEKAKKLDLDFLDKQIKNYMQELGKLEEYNNYDFWKDDKYKAGIAIKELSLVTNNQYKIEKDNNEDYIFIGAYGIPLYDLKKDVYYVLNSLFMRILSNVTLQLDYIDIENNFRNRQQVNTLLEAIYLYVYNSLDTDNSIRNCNNPDCDEVLIGGNDNKLYCSEACRNRYNKKKGAKDDIKRLVNRIKQRAYNAYCRRKISADTQNKINQEILNKRDKLLNNKVTDISIYEEEFNKILKKNNIIIKTKK